MNTQEALYSIALRRCAHIGDITFFKLIKAIGSAEKVWNLPRKDFKILGIGPKIISEIGNSDHLIFAESELNYCEKNDVKILLRHHDDLPYYLSECTDAPAILYAKGNFNSNKIPISIVGTRNITTYGKTFIKDFMLKIKSNSVQTISGLAYGVDAEVHRQSLENSIPTIGVLAHGFQTLYPSKHKNLSLEIIEKGGVLFTEFNSSQKPDRENFIRRNRIVAGISPATIVIETAFEGGSMSTANFANGYNREVYALPGRITDKYSQGCNLLITQNKAIGISSLNELIESLNLSPTSPNQMDLFTTAKDTSQLSDFQNTIYLHIQEKNKMSLDDLSLELSKPTFEILTELLELELLGFIKSHSGQQFSVS